MKKFILLLFLAVKGFAVVLTVGYVADSAVGTGSGVDAANAASMTNHNANTIPSGTITSGTACTIHFVGTIATPCVIPVSGTAGNLITYVFDASSKFSKGNWNQSGTNGDAAIYATGKSYITINGANVGIIECTSNGLGLATSLDCVGIYIDGTCSGWNIKNLTIRTIWVRVQGAGGQLGNNIKFGSAVGGGHVVDACTLSDSASLVSVSYLTGFTGIEVKNCIGTNQGIGSVVVQDQAALATCTGVLIHDNSFSKTLAWAGDASVHMNLVYVIANNVADNTTMTGTRIYNNTLSGYSGDRSTSFIYIDGFCTGTLVYCNLFLPTTNDFTGNGFVFVKGTFGTVVGNNTFVGQGDGNGISTNAVSGQGTGLIVKNNVTVNVATPFYDEPKLWQGAGASYDYNVWYLGTSWYAGTGADTFAQWKTEISSQISGGVGGDTHSVTTTPNLNGSYYPIATSSAIGTGSNFADMSAYYTTDKAGVAWAGGTGWGGGALKATGTVTSSSSLAGKIILSGKASVK